MKIPSIAAGLLCACALAFPPGAKAQRGGRIGSRDGGIGGREGGIRGQEGGHVTHRPARPAPVARPVVPLIMAWPVPEARAAAEAPPAPTAPPPRAVPTPAPEPSSIQPSPTLAPPFQSGTAAAGSLRLDIEPASGLLYVDGFYAGRSEDIARSPTGLKISAGWHRLEIRSPGYETLASNVTIVAGQSNTVRASLHALQR